MRAVLQSSGAYIAITLDMARIQALQLNVDAGSVAMAIIRTSKLHLRMEHLRQALSL